MKVKKPSGAILSYETGKYSSATFDAWFEERVKPLNDHINDLLGELGLLYAAIDPDKLSDKGLKLWREAMGMRAQREKP